MSWDDVLSKTALAQAELIRTGQISSAELVRATLERIEARNPKLNAFVTVFHRRAMRAAEAKDRAVRRGGPLPAFHGVPTAIKDLNIVRFSRTRMGSLGSWPLISPVDDRSAASVRRGGFVILGKTATSELGAMPVTEPDLHPPTQNPWNPAHSSGGSSGGAAAAVAAGLLPIAHGSDGGGSIRGPSSFCHLYGIKPSRGRVANAYGLDDRELLYSCGPLAKTVEDAAALLDIFAGLDVGRPHWAPAPERPFRATLDQPLPPLRIAFTTQPPIGQTSPDIAAAVARAARLLADAGHQVSERALPPASMEEFLPVWQHLVATMPFIRWSRTQPITKWLHDEGLKFAPVEVQRRRRELEARFLKAFDEIDVWLTPTTPVTAPRIGAFSTQPAKEAFLAAAPIGAFTAIFNVTGQPAANVPLGLSAEGLPMGLQVAGKPFADDVVLRVSRLLEQRMPWAGRVAPRAA